METEQRQKRKLTSVIQGPEFPAWLTGWLSESCPLLTITFSSYKPNTRPRIGGNNGQPLLLSVLSMACSLKIQQDLGLH